MDSVGELLRRERLRQGLELAQVAERTRINPNFLEAIETGDTASLPGAFFHRAFVRQYARALGVEERYLETALSELREQAEAALPLPDSASRHIEVPPIPTPGAKQRLSGPRPSSLILLVAVIVACSGVYALWQRTRSIEPVVPAPQPARVEAKAPPVQPPPVPPAETPKPTTATPDVTPEPVPATKPPETAKTEAPSPTETPLAAAKLNIEVVASEKVWLSATSDGKKTTTVLTEGQSRRFAGNDRASLFIGNAGGIEIRVNGKSLGAIGPRGQLRTVLITPEGVTISNPREKKAQPIEP